MHDQPTHSAPADDALRAAPHINDIALYRALTDGADQTPEASVVRAMYELAARSLRRRLAWLGALSNAALADGRPAVRAAALSALSGARGGRARDAIERGLDDDHDAVRAAAIRSLRTLSAAEPGRWLVATTHRRDDVRASAIAVGAPVGAELYELPLLADPTLRPQVEARLRAWLASASATPPAGVLFVLDAVRRGWIEAPLAVAYVAKVAREALNEWIAQQPARSIDAEPDAADPETFDAIDELLGLEWSDATPPDPSATLWWRLVCECDDDATRVRIAASAWALFKRKGSWSAGGVVACFLFAPQTLVSIPLHPAWCAIAIRARVASSMITTANAEAARALAERHPLRRDPSAPLDAERLTLLASIAHIDQRSSAERSLAFVGEDALVAAIEAHPREAALLVVEPSSSIALWQRLASIVEARTPSAVTQLATATLELGGPCAERVVELFGPRAALEALLEHARRARPHISASDPRVIVARRLGAAAVEALWDHCTKGAPPSPTVFAWLVDALDAQPADTLASALRARNEPDTDAARALLDALSAQRRCSLATAVSLARIELDRALRVVTAETVERAEVTAEIETSAPIQRPDAAALDDLTYVDDATLATTIVPFLHWPTRGVAAAFEHRDEPKPAALICAALLRADDGPEHVATVLPMYWPREEAERELLDELAATHLAHRTDLGLLASAWLYRWERHALRFVEIARRHGSIEHVLSTLDPWPPELAARAWAAAARAVEITAGRDGGALFEASLWQPVVALALDEARGDDREIVRDNAALLLVALSRTSAGRALIEPFESHAREARRQLPAARAALLAPWLERPVSKRAELSAEARALRERLKELRTTDAERVARELDSAPDERRFTLIDALAMDPPSPARAAIIAMSPSWTGPMRARLDAALAAIGAQTAVEIELARVARGEVAALDRAIQRARSADTRLTDATMGALFAALGPREIEVSVELLGASCAANATFVLGRILSNSDFADGPYATDDGRRTLAVEVERALLRLPASEDALRRRAARWLWARGATAGFVVLAQGWFAEPTGAPDWLGAASPEHVSAMVDAALTGGAQTIAESALIELLRACPAIASQLWSQLLSGASLAETRQAAINELNRGRFFRTARTAKLRAIAKTFAWGALVSVELTGRAMSLQLARDQTLGYTRLDEDRIFISALPLLRGERFGRAVVEGLILHELGHHRYHRGVEQREAWDEGAAEGIGPLLNLVADEHLERNIRALDAEYGDRLKKLTAYAFQHMDRPIAIDTLFDVLRGAMLEVLSTASVRFAIDAQSVIVEHGRLLQALEKSGSSFARWVRALRMGLGDRHNDEKVSRALALFSGTAFRKSTMRELLAIAREVRAIFGDECRLLGVCSTHEDVGQGEPGDVERATEGITDEEIRREVDRIVNPKRSEDDGMSGARPGAKRWLNVTEATDFDLITEVVRVRYESSKHHALSTRVRRSAGTLRVYLERLGLHLQPERLRLRGRRVDAPRTRALVTRGDPRVLIAREIQVKTDLFIGVVIDCSGSMASGENMPRARLFGALIAEAARAMPSVDVRIFGFTDRVIYDAGDARCPAVHALEAGGGNNDAGALWHAANVARASRRRAKLLVMISDGMPTECSAASLKHLALELTRRHKMCCAQIAVQPLPEVLFPHYVECDGPDTDTVVRRFGRIVEGLIKHAMGVP